VKFYEDAEAVLAHLPRRGVPMILRQVKQGITKPFSFSGMQKIVHTMRDKIGLPSTFTLDACRHGGMTELEEAELTDGQGRALGAQEPASLRRICEAHDGACIVSNSQTSCSQACERGRNEHSE
jgi:hypothetical protein